MAAPTTITRTSGASNARFAAVALLSLGAVLLGASNLAAPTNLSASHLSTGGNGPMPAAEANVMHQAEAGTGPCHDACSTDHHECNACAIPCEQDVLGQACSDCQAAFPGASPCPACFACVASHNHDDQNAAWQAGAHLRAATSAAAMEEEFTMVAEGKCSQ